GRALGAPHLLGAGRLDPHLAGNPDLLGLVLRARAAGAGVARVAALLAAEPGLDLDALALPVALVDALAGAGGPFLADAGPVVGRARLHDLLTLPGTALHVLPFLDLAVDRLGAGAAFRDALVPVGGVRLVDVLGAVRRAGGLVVFRDLLVDGDRPHLR